MKKTIILLVLGTILSCTSKKDEKSEKNTRNKIRIDVDAKAKYSLSELISIDSVLILESSENCLLPSVDQIEIFKDKLYIRCNNTLFIFGSEGHFIHKFCKIGKGPGEYIQLSGFDVMDDGSLLFSDHRGQKIIKYSNDGEFIKEVKTGLWSRGFTTIGNNDLAYIYQGVSFSNKSRDRLNYFSISLKKITKSYFHITDTEMRHLAYVMPRNFIKKNQDSVFFFYPPFKDVYLLTKNKAELYYTVDFGKYSLPEDLLNLNFKARGFSERFRRNKNYVPFLYYFYEDKKNKYLSFNYNANHFYAVVDKTKPKEKSTKVFHRCVDDLFHSGESFEFEKIFDPIANNKGSYVSVFHKSAVNQKITTAVQTYLENQDNPSKRYLLPLDNMNQNHFIVFYSLK